MRLVWNKKQIHLENIIYFIPFTNLKISEKNNSTHISITLALGGAEYKRTFHPHYFDKIQEKDPTSRKNPSCPICSHKTASRQHPENKINNTAQNLGQE